MLQALGKATLERLAGVGGGGGGDASAAKQDIGNTSLASILAKIITAPATEAKQDTGNTSLADILSKIIDAPATEGKQDIQSGKLDELIAAVAASVINLVAHGDVATAIDPLGIGFNAITSLSGITRVGAGSRTRAYADLDGALLVRPYGAVGDRVSGTASNTDGASTQVIAAQAAGIAMALTHISVFNTSAADVMIEIKDGSTARFNLLAPAHSGCIAPLPGPLVGSAATAWNFDPAAATSTTYCNMVGHLLKVT